ncbi:hypothetical protein VNO77_34844 [Canavalia gladiata]|uniref:Transmembrane protein n=1 Tax=Canavalia gladiata TaxID=3824 RepID=A0AAN9PYR5_CANGL
MFPIDEVRQYLYEILFFMTLLLSLSLSVSFFSFCLPTRVKFRSLSIFKGWFRNFARFRVPFNKEGCVNKFTVKKLLDLKIQASRTFHELSNVGLPFSGSNCPSKPQNVKEELNRTSFVYKTGIDFYLWSCISMLIQLFVVKYSNSAM